MIRNIVIEDGERHTIATFICIQRDDDGRIMVGQAGQLQEDYIPCESWWDTINYIQEAIIKGNGEII